MDLFLYLYKYAGRVMALFDEGLSILGEDPPEVLWSCRICGLEGRGGLHWDEASSRAVGWAVLDTLCCPQPSLAVSIWGVVSEYPARILWRYCSVHNQGPGSLPYEGWDRVAEIDYIFQGLDEDSKGEDAGGTFLPTSA